jgi:hypothetical protein
VNGEVTRVAGGEAAAGRVRLEATLDAERMVLSMNGKEIGRATSPGLIPVQPKDPLSIGRDVRSAAGDYEAPNSFQGVLRTVRVKAGGKPFVMKKSP